MNPIASQQVALDNALVAPENQVHIGKCNMRIDPTKTPKEPTYQVVLDALAITTCYPSFLITAEVPEIYMHQFWHTITKIKNSSSYTFKLDKKKFTIDIETRNSPAYKMYLAFSTRAATLKKERKFKKPDSPSKKKALIAVEELANKPVKKPAARRYKGETNIHQVGGSSKGAGIEPEVPDEQKGKSSDSNEGTGLILGVPDVSKEDSSESEICDDEEETQKDEFVYTLENYVPTDDENVDDEEYERINKEMYDDVNVELKDAKPVDEGKGDEEMIDAEKVNAENENVNQEVAGDQVNDDAQATV
nr:hypothetical protein [Tanacetum cinerariifolium]